MMKEKNSDSFIYQFVEFARQNTCLSSQNSTEHCTKKDDFGSWLVDKMVFHLALECPRFLDALEFFHVFVYV